MITDYAIFSNGRQWPIHTLSAVPTQKYAKEFGKNCVYFASFNFEASFMESMHFHPNFRIFYVFEIDENFLSSMSDILNGKPFISSGDRVAVI